MNEQLNVYKEMLNKAKDIILLMDENGSIAYANEEAGECYGYTLNELLTMNIADLRRENKSELVKQQLNSAKLEGIEFETIHF